MMNKAISFLCYSITIFCLSLLLFSCKKDKGDTEDDFEGAYAGKEVYVAGDLQTNKAILWKNGKPTYLHELERSGVGNEVIGQGQDIYVGGITYKNLNGSATNQRSAVYWKNNTKVIVDNLRDTEINNMYIANNGDVYALGYYYKGNPNWDVIWKNGKQYAFQPYGDRVDVKGMTVIANDFYIYGSYIKNNYWYGIIWKNGKVFKLYNINEHVDYMYSDGKDIYYYIYKNQDLAAEKRSFTVYKNSSIWYSIVLTEQEWRSSPRRFVFQKGLDSYVAFDISDDSSDIKEVRIWKNGKQVNTSIKGIFSLTALYVKDSDIYTAVLKEDKVFQLKPELYKNSQLMPMDYDNKTSARFNAIYVK